MITLSHVIYFLIIAGLLAGVLLIYEGLFGNRIIKQKIRISKIFKDLIDCFADKSNDEIFDKVGLRLSIKRYTAYRNLIAIILLVIAVWEMLTGQPTITIKISLILALYMVITIPKNEIFKGKKSPFKILVDLAYIRRQNILDSELSNIVAQMRNLIISNNKAVSADYIFTRLIPHTNLSKSIFVQTHSFMQKGRKDDAALYFKNAFDTWLGNEFSQVLTKLDTLPPREFIQHLDILQESINENKETETDKKRERKKALIFTFASIQMALIIFDFIYIVLMDSISVLSTI